jgi:hypothetical protein
VALLLRVLGGRQLLAGFVLESFPSSIVTSTLTLIEEVSNIKTRNPVEVPSYPRNIPFSPFFSHFCRVSSGI